MDKRLASAAALATLLVGTAALAIGAVAAGTGLRDDAQTRPMGSALSLAVIVRDHDGHAVPGAQVTIVAIQDGERHRIDRDQTDRRGVAVFELRPGGYEIHVSSEAGKAVELLRLHESQRVPITLEPQRMSRG